MNIIIKQINNPNDWDNFIKEQEYTLFVQSYKYGEFFKLMNEDYWIFGIYDNQKLIGGSLILSTHAKRGNFLYLPYGPLVIEPYLKDLEIILKSFFQELKIFAKNKNYSFIKCTPFLEDSNENKNIFNNLGFKNSPLHILAENTWILSLDKSEEQLLKEMNKNHRNLIRRCEREGVRIEKLKEPNQAALAKFNQLLDITAKRHHFQRFSQKYVNNEYQAFIKDQKVIIYNAYLPDGQLDASAIIFYYQNMAAYRHGASLGLNKKLPTTYLLQWEAIKEARQRGCDYYNFWGIAPENADKKHPFFGITHFKKGFGGFAKDLIHCQDLPLSWKYQITWLVDTFRRIKRGFSY